MFGVCCLNDRFVYLTFLIFVLCLYLSSYCINNLFSVLFNIAFNGTKLCTLGTSLQTFKSVVYVLDRLVIM